DGMEQYGRDQLASTTDIQRLSVVARTHEQIGARATPVEALLGRRIAVGDREAEVIGILADDGRSAEVFTPFNSVVGAQTSVPVTVHLRAHRAEDVGRIAERASAWLDEQFDVGRAGFDVMTNEMRVR